MIQDPLALPEWADVLTDADRRGLTPIFHTNMTRTGRSSCGPTAAWTSQASLQLRPDPGVPGLSAKIRLASSRKRRSWSLVRG
jgi:hypothetical protein